MNTGDHQLKRNFEIYSDSTTLSATKGREAMESIKDKQNCLEAQKTDMGMYRNN